MLGMIRSGGVSLPPKEAGDISDLFFSATGTIFVSYGVTKGEPVYEWNYVTTYGVFVCGKKKPLSPRYPRLCCVVKTRKGKKGREHR
jgi:hypothetical protein